MTKTFTKQWCDGTIDRSHHYYVRIKGKEEMNCGRIDFIDIIRPPLFRDQFDKLMKYNTPEVLAPVPSYDKVKEMSQKIERLEFDNEALEMAHNEGKEINAELVSKNEQLEKQLDIAFKVLHKFAFDYDDTTKPSVFIENSLIALGDMREVE